jgi:hypothetical protein
MSLSRTVCLAGSVIAFIALVGVTGPSVEAEVPPDPSGETMPVGDLDGWRQVFTDDFSTNVKLGHFPEAVDRKWDVYASPIKDTFGHGTYSPRKVVSIHNGVLNEFIHFEDGVFMVAALLPKVPGTSRFGQTYGRYAVRFKTDRIEGYKMAWLLWPDSRKWPRDGEIDFPERNLLSDRVSGFVHHQGAKRGSDQASVSAPYDSDAWHTTVIEWSPGLVVFTLDGVEIERIIERVPDTPMHWVLQTETMLTSTLPPVDAAGNVKIDWVAAWQYDPGATAPAPSTTTTTTEPTTSTTASSEPRRASVPTVTRYRVFRS